MRETVIPNYSNFPIIRFTQNRVSDYALSKCTVVLSCEPLPINWHYVVKLTVKLWHSTIANSQEVYLGDSNNDRQSKMAAETGNGYIFETMWGTLKIPTTNLRFKTMYRWKIVLESEYNSNRKYRYAPQTGNTYISGTVTDSVEIPTPNSDFWWRRAEKD